MFAFENLTIAEVQHYNGNIIEILRPAIDHSVERNMRLYMTYDQSCEKQGGCIPTNIFKNAIIELNNPHLFKEYKPWTYWRDYYGKGSWEPILTYIQSHLEITIESVFAYNTNNDEAFPSNSNFIEGLCHVAWIELYYKKFK